MARRRRTDTRAHLCFGAGDGWRLGPGLQRRTLELLLRGQGPVGAARRADRRVGCRRPGGRGRIVRLGERAGWPRQCHRGARPPTFDRRDKEQLMAEWTAEVFENEYLPADATDVHAIVTVGCT